MCPNPSSIDTNRIDLFQRVPSELRRYLEFMAQIKAEYSSIMRFVIKERLRWGDGNQSDLQPRGKPFEFDGMGIASFELEDDPALINPRGHPNLIQRLAVRGGRRHYPSGGLDQIRTGR